MSDTEESYSSTGRGRKRGRPKRGTTSTQSKRPDLKTTPPKNLQHGVPGTSSQRQSELFRKPQKLDFIKSGINSTNNTQKVNVNTNKHITYSFNDKMKQLNKEFTTIFEISPKSKTLTRSQFSLHWSEIQFTNNIVHDDIISETKQGFLIKTKENKNTMHNLLNILKEKQIIDNFVESKPRTTTNNTANNKSNSFSVIICDVEPDILDKDISNFLNDKLIFHRYCKRIISRATNNPTRKIRIITGDVNAFQKLVQEGLYYRHKHYKTIESNAPPPAPIPCRKCTSFTHTTDTCNETQRCGKCKENHKTINCTTDLPISCLACGDIGHQAWSFKCKKRPLKPIEGLPTIKIKSANKKTEEINEEIVKTSRIHKPMSIHDYIIDTYIYELNKPENHNRNELIQKLRARFADQFQIDTFVNISGNRAYIVMLDRLDNDAPPATTPSHGQQSNITLTSPDIDDTNSDAILIAESIRDIQNMMEIAETEPREPGYI